jgi:DtxR family Mn-dependent transcriptional regulator
MAEGIVRRHALAERLLTDLLKMPWHESHEEAHGVEHAMTPNLEARLLQALGNPTTCPHGNPIPGNASSGWAFLKEQNAFRLTDAHQGQMVRVILISEVVEDESELLRRLQDKGLHPRSVLTILESDPTSAVVFQVKDRVHSVPRDLASKIWVADDASSNGGRS